MTDNTDGGKSRPKRFFETVQRYAGWSMVALLCVLMIVLSLSLPFYRGAICALLTAGAVFLTAREAWRAVDAPEGLSDLHRERAVSTAFLFVILAMWTILSNPAQIPPLAAITAIVGGLHWWTLHKTGKWIALSKAPPERIGTYAFVKESVSLARNIGEDIAERLKASRSKKPGRNG